MPNKASAAKALRQSITRAARNVATKKHVKELVKTSTEEITEKSKSAVETVKKAIQAIDKAAKKNVMHANKASRMKSQLQKKLNSLMK